MYRRKLWPYSLTITERTHTHPSRFCSLISFFGVVVAGCCWLLLAATPFDRFFCNGHITDSIRSILIIFFYSCFACFFYIICSFVFLFSVCFSLQYSLASCGRFVVFFSFVSPFKSTVFVWSLGRGFFRIIFHNILLLFTKGKEKHDGFFFLSCFLYLSLKCSLWRKENLRVWFFFWVRVLDPNENSMISMSLHRCSILTKQIKKEYGRERECEYERVRAWA